MPLFPRPMKNRSTKTKTAPQPKKTKGKTSQERAEPPPPSLDGSGAWFNAYETNPEWHRSVPDMDDSSQPLHRGKRDRRNRGPLPAVVEDEPEISIPVDPSRHKLWYYSSNHVLVNKDRTRRAVSPLIRNRELDEFAREHAAVMAKMDKAIHPDTLKLQSKLFNPSRRVGSNVAKGENIREIHKSMMRSTSARNNILGKEYKMFGMGTATGPSGELYICQIFR